MPSARTVQQRVGRGHHAQRGADVVVVYTTAEIVVGALSDLKFTREPDSTYGYRELVPLPRTGNDRGTTR
jgi:predicted DNA-binding protein with PD1-like motif